jgi:hypothetical protein
VAFCDNTNEASTGVPRPGNAGSNTTHDHIAVIDAALARIRHEFRHGYAAAVLMLTGVFVARALRDYPAGMRPGRTTTPTTTQHKEGSTHGKKIIYSRREKAGLVCRDGSAGEPLRPRHIPVAVAGTQ